MELMGTSLIGYGRGGVDGAPVRVKDPATGESLEPVYRVATPEEIDRAVALADRAAGLYRREPAVRRVALLRAIADGIEANRDEIVGRAMRETALTEARLVGELGRTTGQLRLFARVVEEGHWVDARIDHADPERKPVPKPDVRSMLEPLGTVVVFSSSNFPLAFSVAGGDTASALAAGCPVIVKAHQGHLGTSELVGLVVQEAAQRLGFAEGVFSLLFGSGRELGMALVKDPRVKAVGFTGSRSGGRALMDAAAARPVPIPVYAEMGSVNPVFVLPGAVAARGEVIAERLHGSVTLGVGQFCTNPGLVFVPEGQAGDRLVARLGELMAATPAGVMLTEDICRAYREGVETVAKLPGVRLVARGPREGAGLRGGTALFETDAASFLANRALGEEVFGPATLVVRCAGLEAMLESARVLEGQLTASVHGEADDWAGATELVDVLKSKVGRLVFNGLPTGVEVCEAMHHGGPYPATSDGISTSVGTRAIRRFARPVCYQDAPEPLLPEELRENNPRGLVRLVDGVIRLG
ncbi:MAG: 2,5-dioxovalerate dehydrogenase [Isosphaeraceae bacterium]|jgi:NADP-dependent aldehyde dehydrogenase|nr:MAG: 2,5-dioxovalerate dehydrogenase [Isosphaeraceae bacterium]